MGGFVSLNMWFQGMEGLCVGSLDMEINKIYSYFFAKSFQYSCCLSFCREFGIKQVGKDHIPPQKKKQSWHLEH